MILSISNVSGATTVGSDEDADSPVWRGVAKGVGVFVIEDEREALVMVSGVDDGDEEEDLGDDMLIDRE